jgi:hypothetical protein
MACVVFFVMENEGNRKEGRRTVRGRRGRGKRREERNREKGESRRKFNLLSNLHR